MANLVKVNPRMTLKGVIYDDILKKYLEGKYFSLRIADLPKVRVSGVILQEIGIDSTSKIFQVKDSNAVTHLIYRSGCFDRPEGKPYGQGFTCFNCPREATMGIPVSHEIKVINGVSVSVYGMIDFVCSEACALRQIWQGISCPLQFRQWNMINSEQMLRYLYHLRCPGKHLNPNPDRRLHQAYGGPLDDETFHRGNGVVYYSIPNLEFVGRSVDFVARRG